MKSSSILALLKDTKRDGQLLVGAEVERLGRDQYGKILQYSSHVSPLLRDFALHFGWETALENDGKILALKMEKDSISLEPGAQLEISPGPMPNLFELCRRENELSEQLLSLPVAAGWSWLWLGVNPEMSAEEVELIPYPRYQIMTDYFPRFAKRGLEMMRLTTGSHLNLDFYHEEEAIKILQAGLFLSVAVGAIFANSRYYKNKDSGILSVRAKIWEGMDPLRSGMPKVFFENDFKIKDYVNLVESTPLMFYVDTSGNYQAAEGRRFQDLTPDLQQKNALGAMRQLFYDVRIKPCCVEFRALDQQEPRMRISAFAFIVGILYDEENRRWAMQNALSWGHSKAIKLQSEAAEVGMKNSELYELIKEAFSRAERGLVKRGFNEESLLKEMSILISSRKTPAELSRVKFGTQKGE